MADALRRAGVEVHVHDDLFPPDARDEDWLREVGRRGWVVLTKDDRIRYRTAERTVLLNAGVAAFTLVARNLRGAEMAEVFVKALPAIIRFAARNTPPFIAKVTRDGSVSMVFSGEK